MRSRNKFETTALKSVLSDMTYADKVSTPSAARVDCSQVLLKAVKKRRDAFDAYVKADRDDLAKHEAAELALLESFLPKQKSAQELEAAVVEALGELGSEVPEKRRLPMAMKLLSSKLNSVEAPRAEIAKILKRLL